MLITDNSSLKKYYSCHRVWQGIPGIARTKKGRTFVCFYSGSVKETYGNYALLIKSDNGTDFSEPIAVAEKQGKYRCFDPVLWIDPLGRLWFIWNVMPGEEVYASVCNDPDADELVWSKEFYIGRGIMMNKPTVLSSGEWLFPIAMWRFDIFPELRERYLDQHDVAGSYVYKTSDNGKTFVRLGCSDIANRSFDEHMVIERNDGTLLMLVRLQNGIGESISYDRGRNWSKGKISPIQSPSSRFFIQKLGSGRVLLINHCNFSGRNNLTACLSKDDGKTFPYSLLLDERSSVSYPDAIECDDGYVYIVYDRERGCTKSSLQEAYEDAREILSAKITEEDIINGNIVSEYSYLKKVVSRLGKLDCSNGDPFSEKIAEDVDFAEYLIENDVENPFRVIFERYLYNGMNITGEAAKEFDGLIEHYNGCAVKKTEELASIIRYMRDTPQVKKDMAAVVEKVRLYFEAHLNEAFSVEKIRKNIDMSFYFVSYIFNETTGTGIEQYFDELRLTKAKMLLQKNEQTLMQIANLLGYAHMQEFSDAFENAENITPSEYRLLHK